MHTRTHAHRHTFICPRARAPTRTYSHAHTHTHTHTHVHTQTYAYTHMQTRTHAHTHTHLSCATSALPLRTTTCKQLPKLSIYQHASTELMMHFMPLFRARARTYTHTFVRLHFSGSSATVSKLAFSLTRGQTGIYTDMYT